MPGNNEQKFFDMGIMLYAAFLHEKPLIRVPDDYVNISEAVVKKIGWKSKVSGVNYKFTIGDIKENKKVMIGLSGGLDSVYFMHRLIDDGYDVTAVYVDGLNKSSAKIEAKQAKKIAREAQANFLNIKMKVPSQTFPDNPFKNQLILSTMLNLGIKKGIYRYALGCDWTSPLRDAITGYTITDSEEVNKYFWEGVKKHFPQAELMFIDVEDKKYKRFDWLYKNHYNSLVNVSSCVSPLRFREHLHKKNISKYNVNLLQGRCGSCYKCAIEYILLVETRHIKKNARFYDHCWDILNTSKTYDRPDWFAAKLPLEKRLENLLDIGS